MRSADQGNLVVAVNRDVMVTEMKAVSRDHTLSLSGLNLRHIVHWANTKIVCVSAAGQFGAR